jgi:probable rRNA maturation factor
MFRLHCNPDLPDVPSSACRKRLAHVARKTLSRYKAGGHVDVILTGDEQVRRLNNEYRGRDRATDVLSFSFVEDEQVLTGADESTEDIAAGEVYISVDRAREQATDLGVGVDEEMARLLIHGLLHLAGYDHQTEADLQEMEHLTEEVLVA